MSSNRNDNSDAGMAMAALAMIVFFIFAVLVFVSLIMTMICLLAWNRPRKIASIVVQPWEARLFVRNGLVGAVLFPIFLGFCQFLYDVKIDWDYLLYYLLSGYMLGSVGVGLLVGEEGLEAWHQSYRESLPQFATRKVPTPAPYLPPPEMIAPKQSSAPFQFADWDDREAK
jgi:hypothetical protein